MKVHRIEVKWKGPHSTNFVIAKMVKGGNRSNCYDGPDYGLYQIYGKHILCKEDTLLYVGKAIQQTFSNRFKQHKKEWLDKEENIRIYLGRIDGDRKYSKADNWVSWERDVEKAEAIIIYKYSPHYNSSGISQEPEITTSHSIKLVHKGKRHQLHREDNAPRDWKPRPRE